jgi:uncharacterized protein (DUF1684 family)
MHNLPKKILFCVTLFICSNVLAQDALILEEIKQHREGQYAKFTIPEMSPITEKQIKEFKGLNYYAPDLKYRVNATFIKYDKPSLIKMKTTVVSRQASYANYGEVQFELDGNHYTLVVFQDESTKNNIGYEDLLFIPFTDKTNGHETYDIGRYLDIRIPNTTSVILDFNKCYNPYCSYASGFACEIPPASNALPIAIPVGEKKYESH